MYSPTEINCPMNNKPLTTISISAFVIFTMAFVSLPAQAPATPYMTVKFHGDKDLPYWDPLPFKELFDWAKKYVPDVPNIPQKEYSSDKYKNTYNYILYEPSSTMLFGKCKPPPSPATYWAQGTCVKKWDKGRRSTGLPMGATIVIDQIDDFWGMNTLESFTVRLDYGVDLNIEIFANVLIEMVDPDAKPGEQVSIELGKITINGTWGCDDSEGKIVVKADKVHDLVELAEKIKEQTLTGMLQPQVEIADGDCWLEDAAEILTAGFYEPEEIDTTEYANLESPIELKIGDIPTGLPFDQIRIDINSQLFVSPSYCSDGETLLIYKQEGYGQGGFYVPWEFWQPQCLIKDLYGKDLADKLVKESPDFLDYNKVKQEPETPQESKPSNNQPTLAAGESGQDVSFFIDISEEGKQLESIDVQGVSGLFFDINALSGVCTSSKALSGKCPKQSQLGSGEVNVDENGTKKTVPYDMYLASSKADPKATYTIYQVFKEGGSYFKLNSNVYLSSEDGLTYNSVTEVPESVNQHFSKVRWLSQTYLGDTDSSKSILYSPTNCSSFLFTVTAETVTPANKQVFKVGPEVTGCSGSSPKFEPQLTWSLNNTVNGAAGINTFTVTQAQPGAQMKSIDLNLPKGFNFNYSRALKKNGGKIGYLKIWSPVTTSPTGNDVVVDQSAFDVGAVGKPIEANSIYRLNIKGTYLDLPMQITLKLNKDGSPLLQLSNPYQIPITKIQLSTDGDLIMNPYLCGVQNEKATMNASSFSGNLKTKEVASNPITTSCDYSGTSTLPKHVFFSTPYSASAGNDVGESVFSILRHDDPASYGVGGFEIDFPSGSPIAIGDTASTCTAKDAIKDKCPQESKLGTVIATFISFKGTIAQNLEGDVYSAGGSTFFIRVDGNDFLATDDMVWNGSLSWGGENYSPRLHVTGIDRSEHIRAFILLLDNGMWKAPASCGSNQTKGTLLANGPGDWFKSTQESGFTVTGCDALSYLPGYSWTFIPEYSKKYIFEPLKAGSSPVSKLVTAFSEADALTESFVASTPMGFTLMDSLPPACGLADNSGQCSPLSKVGNMTVSFWPALTWLETLSGPVHLTGHTESGFNARAYLYGAFPGIGGLPMLTLDLQVSNNDKKVQVTSTNIPPLQIKDIALTINKDIIKLPNKCNIDSKGSIVSKDKASPFAQFHSYEQTLTKKVYGPPVKIGASCPIDLSDLKVRKQIHAEDLKRDSGKGHSFGRDR